MNERMQKLADEAEDYADTIVDQGGEFHPAYTKKFAELLVQECCSVAKTVLYKETFGVEKRVSWNNGIAEALDTIVEHFGVK